MESADAVLVRNDLASIPFFIGLSMQAYAVIRQNIFWAFFYNIVAIPLAVSGLLHPIVAAGQWQQVPFLSCLILSGSAKE